MRKKQAMKIMVDIAMTIILIFLMTYNKLGEVVHEWLGIGMFLLLVIHHIFNIRWSKAIFRGKYTAFRIFQTTLVVLCMVTMIGSMISGIMLSKHIFLFLNIQIGMSLARFIHMLCAYWGFVFMTLHIGLHWSVMINRMNLLVITKKRSWILLLRIIVLCIAIYGGYAFIQKNLISYMLLKTRFVFFDFNETLASFLFDYISIMVLFVMVGYYISMGMKRIK